MNKEKMKELYNEFHDAEKEFYDLQNTVIALCKKEQEHDKEIRELKSNLVSLKFNIKMSLITFIGVPLLTVSMFLIVFKLF
jgi:peptidoglycan hydrolase CwlO-like protein